MAVALHCYDEPMSFQLFGLPVSRGVAIGRAVLVASSRIDVAHYFIDMAQVDNEIARLQSVSVHTVQSHIKSLYSKLAVHSKMDAVFEATRMGLLPRHD